MSEVYNKIKKKINKERNEKQGGKKKVDKKKKALSRVAFMKKLKKGS